MLFILQVSILLEQLEYLKHYKSEIQQKLKHKIKDEAENSEQDVQRPARRN